jgi:hypothetical protein
MCPFGVRKEIYKSSHSERKQTNKQREREKETKKEHEF